MCLQANVMGAHCDLCRPGFFNLQADNPLGCSACFCFGVSDVCESSHWPAAQVGGWRGEGSGRWWRSSEAAALLSDFLVTFFCPVRCFSWTLGSTPPLSTPPTGMSCLMLTTPLATPMTTPTKTCFCGMRLMPSWETR